MINNSTDTQKHLRQIRQKINEQPRELTDEQALAITPLDRLLVETDDEPSASIEAVLKAVAKVKQCSPRSLRRQVRRTALQIVKYK